MWRPKTSGPAELQQNPAVAPFVAERSAGITPTSPNKGHLLHLKLQALTG